MQRGEVLRPVALADGLDHLDRGDRIVAAMLVAIVLAQQSRRQVLSGQSLLRVRELRRRQREPGDAMAARAPLLRRSLPSRSRSRGHRRAGRAAARRAPVRTWRAGRGPARLRRGSRRRPRPRARTARSSSSSSGRARARRRRCRGRSARGCCAAPGPACWSAAGGAGDAGRCPRRSRRSPPRWRGGCARRNAAGARGRACSTRPRHSSRRSRCRRGAASLRLASSPRGAARRRRAALPTRCCWPSGKTTSRLPCSTRSSMRNAARALAGNREVSSAGRAGTSAFAGAAKASSFTAGLLGIRGGNWSGRRRAAPACGAPAGP